MQFHEVMWAEMSPDVYDGENCDQVKPRWHAYAEGDMDSEYIDSIELDPKHFPPGTKISIMQPCCPECGEIVEICRNSGNECGFDWEEWTENEYS